MVSVDVRHHVYLLTYISVSCALSAGIVTWQIGFAHSTWVVSLISNPTQPRSVQLYCQNWIDMQTKEVQVVWRFMNLSIDFVTRLLFQMFSLFGSMCCLLAGFSSRPLYASGYTAQKNNMKLFNAEAAFSVSCSSVSINGQDTYIHLMVNAVKMRHPLSCVFSCTA